jgi:hypothetical protein
MFGIGMKVGLLDPSIQILIFSSNDFLDVFRTRFGAFSPMGWYFASPFTSCHSSCAAIVVAASPMSESHRVSSKQNCDFSEQNGMKYLNMREQVDKV